MILNYQQQQKIEKQNAAPAAYQLATVAGVFEDGLTLIFDGEGAARIKHYPCNAAVSFSAGQRVRVEKVGGTYVAAYPIKGGNT